MQIISGIQQAAYKVCIYGVEGIGKSTLAGKFPQPVIYIDTEGSTARMDVKRTVPPQSWTALLGQVDYFIRHGGDLATLVIDTADWAERMCAEELCAKAQVNGIEGFGYGKGYVYLQEEFGRLLDKLTQLRDRGVHVVLVAHAALRKFEEPHETGSYDRWELKLSKKCASMVKEWADLLLFANYKTHVVNVDGKGAAKGRNKIQGGSRVMYATHHPCWDAKNRDGLPDEMPLDYAPIAHLFAVAQPLAQGAPLEKDQAAIQEAPRAPAAAAGAEREQAPAPGAKPVQDPAQAATARHAGAQGDEPSDGPGAEAPLLDVDGGPIPPALGQLMAMDKVTAQEIRAVVSEKGYFPAGMAIRDYAPDFVQGCLIGAWDQVKQMIDVYRGDSPF